MKILKYKELSEKKLKRLTQRGGGNYLPVFPVVRQIINDVRSNGDEAVLSYEKKFGVDLKNLKVTQQEINRAFKRADPKLITSLKQAIKNISAVCKSQLKLKDKPVKTEAGIKVWREFRPIEKVGLYIPGGKADYPSSLLMTAIPAQIAGCKEIIITTPADPQGSVSISILTAAKLLGITTIYKTGGAQAIAALAYGTKTIPKVSKIFGPGNSYVTAAKNLVFGTVNIDMPAGPSEVFIIADETANPSFIAADLLADCEHGEDSSGVLVTTSEEIAKETVLQIGKQLQNLSTAARVRRSLNQNGFILIVDKISQAVRFANDYAPEHLEIQTKNPEEIVKQVKNAGSVFLGNYACKGSGDYATGANHVLPTSGTAKMFSPLSVDSFGKMMEVQKVSKNGLAKIRETIETLAEIEGLPAHRFSATVRFEGDK